jgi:hypothetical protein
MTNSGEQAKLLQVAREAKAPASKAENSQLTDGEQRLANAMRRRVIADGRAREAEQRVADEASRLADTAAKTAKLRQLRLAKEAAQRDAALKVKPVKTGPRR